MQLESVSAIVTGAASGLGAATASTLAARGVTVFGLDLGSAIDKAPVAEGVRLLPADVTSEPDVQAAVAEATASGAPLRIVVNCAGIGTPARLLSKQGPHDLELFRRVLTINTIGTFNVMRLAAEAIARTESDANGQRGVVINTASVAAFEGQIGQLAYAASKGAVAAMTISAARDLAQFGIRVVTIAPGLVNTPMLAGITEEFRVALGASVPFPMRLAEPREYAQLAIMILEHDYLNGETIRMDGALRMAPR